jgi:hypothetical protein
MNAQITFESMLVLVLGISMLLIAVVAVNNLQNAQASIYSYSVLKSKVWEIANLADEICVLGAGNSRTVSLANSGYDFSTSPDKKALIAHYNNLEFGSNTICDMRIEKNKEFDKTVFLWYDDSQVVISSTAYSQTP